MASKSQKREKRRKAREANKLEQTINPKKREHGRQLIIFLLCFVAISTGLVLYLQH